MDESKIVYRPREDATVEGELNALAAVYAFVSRQVRAGERRAGVNEEKGTKDDLPATPSLPHRP
jgi:hypothetical protein